VNVTTRLNVVKNPLLGHFVTMMKD